MMLGGRDDSTREPQAPPRRRHEGASHRSVYFVYESGTLLAGQEPANMGATMRRKLKTPDPLSAHRRRRRGTPSASSGTGRSGSTATTPSEVTVAFHVEKVADLYAREKQLDRVRSDLRENLDRALRHARNDRVQHLQLAIAVVARLGMQDASDEIYKVEQSLRQRCSVAARRVSATDERALVGAGPDPHSRSTRATPEKERDMSNEPRIKSKTITETTITYAMPEDLDEHDDEDDEDEEDDDDAPPPPPPAPARTRRR